MTDVATPLTSPLGHLSVADRDTLSLLQRQGLDAGILRIIEDGMAQTDPVGGRLARYSDEWQRTVTDSWVNQIVTDGVTFDFPDGEPISLARPPQLPMSQDAYEACDNEVREMLLKQAITPLQSEPGDSFINRIFPVTKKDGGTRPVIDCRELNEHIPKIHFKMESLSSVKHTLRRRDYMVKVDIKDAYFHLPIAKRHRRFLRFYWNNQLYEFQALPFGVTSAPRIFTKTMRPVIGILRSRGVRCIIYLDDLLIMATTKEKCLQHLRQTLEILSRLGFRINWKKSSLIPTQVEQFLGLTIDSHEMLFKVPREKLTSVMASLRQLIPLTAVTLRQLAHIIGKLMALEAAVLPVRLRTRELLRNLNHHKGGDWEQRIPLWNNARTEAQWWLDHLNEWNGRAIVLPTPSVTVTTDASDTGWGAVYEGPDGESQTYGFWSLMQKTYGNNVRELLAGGYGLLSFADKLNGRTVELRMDNTTAVSYVKKMGGRKDFLSSIAEDLWDWCIGRQITVIARHLAGKLNVKADALSRMSIDRTDWKLHPEVFHAVEQLWGPFDVDLFATMLNCQIERYVSRDPQPGAWRVDAMSFPWNNIGLPWANPPFILIHRILRKVLQEQATMVIVVPMWSTQTWWPTLLSLLADRPALLPQRDDLYLPASHGNEEGIDTPTWRSIAALISGSARKNRDFQHALQRSLPTVQDNPLPSHTNTSGDDSQLGTTINNFPVELLQFLR